MRRLLIVRPEPGAGATLAKAKAQGLVARAVPLFTVEPIAWDAPDASTFDGLLLTSANAVHEAGDRLSDYRGLQVYAVGEATADAARDAGFGIAATGKAGVDRLLDSIDPGLRLLHLRGEDGREPEEAWQAIAAVPVYRAKTVAAPALGQVDGVVLIHSPRAGRRFAELARNREDIAVAAISETAAEAVGDGWEAVEVAAEPTDDALLALAARLCNKPSPS